MLIMNTWPEGATELEVLTDDDMICRFVVDRDGTVVSFTVERVSIRLNAEGHEAKADEPGTDRALLGKPITATWLKRFAFERALHKAKEQTSWWKGFDDDDESRAEVERIEALPDAPRRGAPGIGDRYYADVARRYVHFVENGSKSPTADLAADLSVKIDTARNHVRRARDLKLLTATYRGKSGGKLTPKAVEILDHDLQGCSGMPATKEDQ